MGLFEGKRGLIMGVANDRSIAWSIAKEIMNQGGECGFTHLPDRADDDKKRNRARVEKCTSTNPLAKFLVPMDIQQDSDLEHVAQVVAQEFGQIDFLLHSIAFAKTDDLKLDTIDTSRDGFALAMDVSVYSLIAACRYLRPLMKPKAAICCMTYLGGEKCVPGYNVMGICKAALDATTRYLAHDLGPQGIRVNAISAGPVYTLAGSAAGVKEMLAVYEGMSPLGRNITNEELGKSGAFLLSDMSDGITGEILHLDCGFSIMGSPGRLADKMRG
jgi:enoyl-[acyl-carrier protein] reductase I